MASVEAEAVIVTEATFCQLSEPPVSVGAVGAVRSSRTVLAAVGLAGNQADVKPAASTRAELDDRLALRADRGGARRCAGVPQVAPPSVDVRYW